MEIEFSGMTMSFVAWHFSSLGYWSVHQWWNHLPQSRIAHFNACQSIVLTIIDLVSKRMVVWSVRLFPAVVSVSPEIWCLQVLIRTRPISSTEMVSQGFSKCLKQESPHTLTWLGPPETRFTFDHVAGEIISQVRMHANLFAVPCNGISSFVVCE